MSTRNFWKTGGAIGSWCFSVLVLVGMLIMPAESTGQTSKYADNEAKVKKAIPPSIVEMDEVDWVEYEDNEVYVGFNMFPSDLKPMINMWALAANRELNFGVRVFAVLKAPKGWRPGTPCAGLYIGAARHGKIEN